MSAVVIQKVRPAKKQKHQPGHLRREVYTDGESTEMGENVSEPFLLCIQCVCVCEFFPQR